jgi:type I restriction enzyme S subunit
MNWTESTLGQLLQLQRGYDLPSDNRSYGEIPIIGSAGITGFHNEAKVFGGGVTIGRSGNSFGKVFKCKVDFWPHNAALYVKETFGNDINFIYYFLLNLDFSNYNSGSAQPSLNRNFIYPIQIKIPPLKTQKRIASILSAYDDLIENNLKRIKLLEETAQNIYKEWFVNFRFPNYESTPFNEETGLPEGWGMKPLNEYVDFKEGPGLRNWQFKDEGIPFLNIRMMGEGELDFSSVKYLESSEVEAKYSHFLLLEFDHIISTSGTLGKVVTIRQSHLPLCLNTSIIRMRPLREEIGRWQLREILTSLDFLNEMKSFATGSAQLNFGPKHLNLMKFKVPTRQIGVEFEKKITPIELQICALLEFNQKLKEARDILLPRLMNRTIEV